MTPLKGIQACVFDAYGTLFDVHSAVAQHSARLVDATAVSTLWRTKQLQYTWLRTLMGRYVEFWQVTGDALDFALETHQVSDSPLREGSNAGLPGVVMLSGGALGAQGVVPARNPVCHSLQWLARDAGSGC
tara:strand:- start:693 stop:1085 length:393 start_codon:yes stop_codon:yes gene_type:complete